MRRLQDVEARPTAKGTSSAKKAAALSSVETKKAFDAKKGNGHQQEASSAELQQLLQVLRAMRAGDFSVRLPTEQTGIMGRISDTFNEIVTSNERMAQQLERVGE